MAAVDRELSPKEGRWIAKPSKPRWVFFPVFFAIFVPQIFNWINLFGGAKNPEVLLLFVYALLAVMVVGMGVAYGLILKSRGSSQEAPVLPDAAFGDQFEAYITIVVEGKRLGSDRGVVWFADDLIGFSGRAASFVLDANDISPQSIPSLRTPSKYPVPIDALVLKGAPKQAYVVVTALKGRANAYRSRLKRFVLPGGSVDERLVRYVTRTRSEERQWPPLSPYSDTSPVVKVVGT